MNRRKLIQTLNAWLLLFVLLFAYTGKSLHTHPDEYYRALFADDGSGSSKIVDNCPLCHFHFFSYICSTAWILTSDFRLLSTIHPEQSYTPQIVRTEGVQLRAPPARG